MGWGYPWKKNVNPQQEREEKHESTNNMVAGSESHDMSMLLEKHHVPLEVEVGSGGNDDRFVASNVTSRTRHPHSMLPNLVPQKI